MSEFKLRDYQESVVSAALNFAKYRRGTYGYCTAAGGSGKSVMIAKLAEAVLDADIFKHVVILARNEKLLKQNMAKLSLDWQLKTGVYCAGLGSKDIGTHITIASVQSISGAMNALSDIEQPLILLDECHNATNDPDDDTQFWKFMRGLQHPTLVGFTATPYRLRGGAISWGNEIINIPLTIIAKAGFLVLPVNKAPVTPDLSNIDIKLGEYVESQLEAVFTDPELLRNSVEAILRYLPQRRCCIVFTQTRKHSDVLLQSLRDNGIAEQAACCVDGTTDKRELSDILDDWANPNHPLKIVINCQLLKEGIDVPAIDMVVSLRSTISKTLWEQILYRGTRPADDKSDFLVLDMGGNFQRLGALGSPYTGETGMGTGGKPLGRICPSCESFTAGYTHAECPDCGFVFPEPEVRQVDHDAAPDHNSAAYYDASSHPQWHDVKSVTYEIHHSRRSGNKMIRVNYHCAYESHSEYLLPLHESEYVREKAIRHYRDGGNDIGDFGWNMKDKMKEEQILEIYLQESMRLAWPSSIKVQPQKKNPKYTEVASKIYEETDRGGDTTGGGDVLEEDFIPF